ncbi:MAG: DinB family protein [Ktedonobacterales bacterium]|nr:DinB family protein [Ktedonobacterales bacterium]
MSDDLNTLAPYYRGWDSYQKLLVEMVAPRTDEELAVRAAEGLRPAWMIAAHIVAARVWWFHSVLGEGDADLEAMRTWDDDDQPPRQAAELEMGLEKSWRLIHEVLARWRPADLAAEFPRRGHDGTVTRQWVIWHVIEHDLHHGGELSLTLGMHGLLVPEL